MPHGHAEQQNVIYLHVFTFTLSDSTKCWAIDLTISSKKNQENCTKEEEAVDDS